MNNPIPAIPEDSIIPPKSSNPKPSNIPKLGPEHPSSEELLDEILVELLNLEYLESDENGEGGWGLYTTDPETGCRYLVETYGAERTKAIQSILQHFISIESVREAVGKMETNGARMIGVPAGQRDELRKEILQTLGIEEKS